LWVGKLHCLVATLLCRIWLSIILLAVHPQLPNKCRRFTVLSMSPNSSRPLGLDRQLETLEQKWFAVLQAEFIDQKLPPSASSEVQFLSTDFPWTSVPPQGEADALPSRSSGSAPCIVCISINHNTYRNRGEHNKITPHIYSRTRGVTWTVDRPRTRATRRALNTALAFYLMNAKVWTENGYASDPNLLPITWDGREADLPFVLLKVYLSPFILTKPWAEYSETVRRETLDAWNPNRHIVDFIATLNQKIDLWVIQGNYVWPHFVENSEHITKWILTPTLSYESQRNGAIAAFWRAKRVAAEELAQPTFPSCAGIP
jgi:hypothetical protein